MLLAAGHSVVGIDNLNDYYDVRLKFWRLQQVLGESAPFDFTGAGEASKLPAKMVGMGGRYVFYRSDIEDLRALEAIFSEHKFDAVYNLAARAGVRYSMENPHVYLSTNTLGTLNILEMMRKHGVPAQVLASTSSLYAGCPMPFSEDLPVNTPLSPYAATKKAAELMSYSYHKLYGLSTTVLRYFTVFGPAGRPDMSIFRFIKWIDEGKQVEVFGDGLQSRDFTYVTDIARGTIAAAALRGYNIINLGGGRNPVTLQAVLASIERSLGKPAIIKTLPFHAADIKETWADIGRANSLLSWTPEVSLDEGLRRSVEWYVANRQWLKNVNL